MIDKPQRLCIGNDWGQVLACILLFYVGSQPGYTCTRFLKEILMRTEDPIITYMGNIAISHGCPVLNHP